jgi:hypothetical protein
MELHRFRILLFLWIPIFFSCKKEAGFGGKKEVSGKVTYKDGVSGTTLPAPGAILKVAFGSRGPTSDFDYVISADTEVNYFLKGLNPGEYYFTAQYRDANGFEYSTPGATVIIKRKKNELNLNFVLE